MITDEDRAALGDLAMRAIDKIIADYGDDAELCAATLIFEVRTKDTDGDDVYHGNYESLVGNTPHHIGGLAQSLANWLLTAA
jgi:hypothetical protein